MEFMPLLDPAGFSRSIWSLFHGDLDSCNIQPRYSRQQGASSQQYVMAEAAVNRKHIKIKTVDQLWQKSPSCY